MINPYCVLRCRVCEVEYNVIGHNTVIQLDLQEKGKYKYAWWPLCVDQKGKPKTNANYLQLNSIAAGSHIRNSFFSASTDEVSLRRPGHRNFSVDGKGVIFSGVTRKPICEGLTRPHSARLYQNKIWVNNSGYGEFGFVNNNQFQSIVTLPGWTRGLWIHKGIAFVGTSKVIPRFYQYAPGLKFEKSVCGIFAVELKTGKIL